MSWRYYEILTTPPDFSDNPVAGTTDERSELDLDGAARFAAWPGRTSRTFQFSFQTFAPEEWTILRNFFDQAAGRAKAFYVPTWMNDLELLADAASGANQITVVGHPLSPADLSNRPDTIGRRIQITNQAGQSANFWLNGIAASGANDVLVLNRPLPFDLEAAGRTTISICYLCRLAGDSIESDHISPTHARTRLTFLELSHRKSRTVEDAAEGTAYGKLKANATCKATDQDPIYTDLTTTAAIGPFVLGIPQSGNFQTDWTAELNHDANQVFIEKPGYSAATSLYNAPAPANQIALTFDATSNAILAWELDGKVTIAWKSGTTQRRTFQGYSPVAITTYAIDATSSAGNAVAAVFYLKRDDTTIFCRLFSENFATEHRYVNNSPVAPIWLNRARRNETVIELVGMDAHHRRAIWTSEEYVTPGETLVIDASLGTTISGFFRSIVEPGEGADGATAAIGTTITGSFSETRVQRSAESPGAVGSIGTTVTGSVTDIRVYSATDAEDSSLKAGLASTLNGTYSLQAINRETTPVGPKAAIGTTITGTYIEA